MENTEMQSSTSDLSSLLLQAAERTAKKAEETKTAAEASRIEAAKVRVAEAVAVWGEEDLPGGMNTADSLERLAKNSSRTNYESGSDLVALTEYRANHLLSILGDPKDLRAWLANEPKWEIRKGRFAYELLTSIALCALPWWAVSELNRVTSF